MDLVEETAAVRFERAMNRAGRAAGIGSGGKALAALPHRIVADRQVAVDQVDLFPIFMDEGFGREDAGREPQQPRAAAAAPVLVERARQDLLLDAGWIAERRRPARAHVDAVEFEM